jgi:DNA-binding NtrC family response regulator
MMTPSRSTVREPRLDATAERLDLIVTGESIFVSQPLPGTGQLLIGRATDADVRIDHASISRQHAIVRVGTPITIEDLGSANGTRLHGRLLPAGTPVPIRPGEVVDLGSVLLVVQPRPRTAPARRVWSHDYFEGRVEEECARAARTSARFALLHVATAAADAAGAREAVLGALGGADVIGAYAPGAFEVMIVDADGAAGERTARQIVTAAANKGVVVRTGVAVYPRDGTSAHTLIAHATAEAAAGGDRADRAGPRPLAPAPQPGAMSDLRRLAEQIAAGTISVLILGETGSGKEVMAETIHRLSPRRAAPFLRLNCAALTETLLESELFGHERGSFTGANAAKPGLLETADGGTVFLDEVGELAQATQVKLLRVLEERAVLRVGGLKPRAIDVRFVAATNRDLEAEVERGAFRRDLYYRLSAATLVVPPLRERAREIPELARSFVAGASRDAGRDAPPAIAPAALAMLVEYSWPGNIRELRNMMERAVLLCGAGPIEPVHLPVEKMRATLAPGGVAPAMALPVAAVPPPSPPPSPATSERLKDVVKQHVQTLERERIVDALARAAGNQSAAAKLLGMPRRTLVKRLRAYGIPRPRSDNQG